MQDDGHHLQTFTVPEELGTSPSPSSPISALPPELLGRIFVVSAASRWNLNLLKPWPNTGNTSSAYIFKELLHVCLSTPEFWSYAHHPDLDVRSASGGRPAFRDTIAQLELVLKRSGKCLLALSWALSFGLEDYDRLRLEPSVFPRVFSSAMARTVELKMDWYTILSWRFALPPGPAIHAPHLRRADIMASCESRHATPERIEDLPSTLHDRPCQRIYAPNLRHLFCRDIYSTEFLHFIGPPPLERLEFMQDDNMSAPFLQDWEPFLSFLEKFQPLHLTLEWGGLVFARELLPLKITRFPDLPHANIESESPRLP